MKVLYSLQGTGNGHIARALEFVPILQKRGNVDVFISGDESQVVMPFEIKKHYKGLTFKMSYKGGISYLKTLVQFNFIQFIIDVINCPVQEYDLVINDFEPVVAWACKLKGVPCIGMSHQSAVVHKNSPKPRKKNWLGTFILKNYAPTTTNYGFHFRRFGKNIHGPIIRSKIKNLEPRKRGFYTVYLPSYSEENIILFLKEFPEVKWKVFSKYISEKKEVDHIKLFPIDQKKFLKAIKNCSGVLCGAGFELPSESLYLNKKLMVIPVKNQYEQYCNAAALNELGVPVIFKLDQKAVEITKNWIASKQHIELNFNENPVFIIDRIIIRHCIYKKNYKKPFWLKPTTN